MATHYDKFDTKTINLNTKQAEMVGNIIASQHKQLQATANKHRVYHPTITAAAHEYMNETYDLLNQLGMEHLIMPRRMRNEYPSEDQ